MTSDETHLAAIRQREQAATAGPWKRERNWHVVAEGHDWSKCWLAEGITLDNYDRQFDKRVAHIFGPGNGNNAAEDFEFIAHARADIPYLLAQLDAQAQTIQRLEADADPEGEPAVEICAGCQNIIHTKCSTVDSFAFPGDAGVYHAECWMHQRDRDATNAEAEVKAQAQTIATLTQDIDARTAARDKAFKEFGHTAERKDGKCQCPYCTGDAEALAEMTAEYELQKEYALQKLAKSEADLLLRTQERDELRAALAPKELVASSLTRQHYLNLATASQTYYDINEQLKVRLTRLTEGLRQARFYVEAFTGAKDLTTGMAEQQLARLDALLTDPD